jgi:hypothetical protein
MFTIEKNFGSFSTQSIENTDCSKTAIILVSEKNDYNKSGRRDSNPRPSAWKADALPTELLPLIILCTTLSIGCVFQKTLLVGGEGFEPSKVKTNRFTVCPRWPLEYPPDVFKLAFEKEPMEGFEPPTR